MGISNLQELCVWLSLKIEACLLARRLGDMVGSLSKTYKSFLAIFLSTKSSFANLSDCYLNYLS